MYSQKVWTEGAKALHLFEKLFYDIVYNIHLFCNQVNNLTKAHFIIVRPWVSKPVVENSKYISELYSEPWSTLLFKKKLASLGVWRVLPTLIVADMQVIVSQTAICGICSLVLVKDVKEECCFSPAETNTRNQTEQPTRMETCQYSFHVTCSTHNANSLSFTHAREIKRTK